jgi:hypothetical protein
MVSKAREDLPEPESPVTTVRVLRGMLTSTLRRLCWRAPRTVMCVIPMYVVWRCSAKSLEYGIWLGGIKRELQAGQCGKATREGIDVSETATGHTIGSL